MIKKLLISLILVPLLSFGQDKEKSTEPGKFQLGTRSTLSAFGTNGYSGTGFGGQFRLKLLEKVNTEWFADYITSDIGGLGRRTDAHIGWSVMFYPFDHNSKTKFVPYIVAGHCFDYTKVNVNNYISSTFQGKPNPKDRWSSAIQMGLGTHYNLSDRFDISLSSQYMTHLGNDIHTDIHEHNGVKHLEIDNSSKNLILEGHVLFTFSVNVLIADIW